MFIAVLPPRPLPLHECSFNVDPLSHEQTHLIQGFCIPPACSCTDWELGQYWANVRVADGFVSPTVVNAQS